MSFKELKQTHRLADFLGHKSNAVRWKVWTELLPFYLLLRFCVFLSQWDHSFTRLSMLPRSALWQRLELWLGWGVGSRRSIAERFAVWCAVLGRAYFDHRGCSTGDLRAVGELSACAEGGLGESGGGAPGGIARLSAIPL